ncbi:MAG: hypothetical protein DCC56_04455 [Anaerolineae bacterium]|nr:MAG: hypothetical protein DCC56_04455 [Anaerolineae bacterium]WKZ43899.1 MAG: hypothetical protein QY302_17520 [Anaerolineales bacterium]
MNRIDYHFEDFTEAEYRKLLRLAQNSWRIIPFGEYRSSGRVCLWRHDVDFSMHRALRLAMIEAEEGVSATYFIHIHSKFYNVFEDEITERILNILNMGHRIGVHFEPQYYVNSLNNKSDALSQLPFEKNILEHCFSAPIDAFSFHIPEMGGWVRVEDDDVHGLINSYGAFIKNNFKYCSDSNGYWRFERLKDILEKADNEKLHILTHPEMWTPEAMSPRARVVRCAEGRMMHQINWYDNILAKHGRENIG